MEKSVTIKSDESLPIGQDFKALMEKGIELAQKLSGKIWTDFNEHDPGVTILEHLCYALTDLSYRTNLPIEDLLNAEESEMEDYSTFFKPNEIFPCNPLTIIDYRKMFIDRIPEIQNIWFQVINDHRLSIKGLYRILIQVDTEHSTLGDEDDIAAKVKRLYAAHRNIGEDVEVLKVLEHDNIRVEAEIDLYSDAIGEQVHAEIFFEIEQYLNPPVRFYNLSELEEEGEDSEDIFDGPEPIHGFIKNEDLKPMATEVYVSKLIEIVSDIKGVRAIRSFKAYRNDLEINGDVIHIENNKYLNLESDLHDAITDKPLLRFRRGNIPYEIDQNTANQIHFSLHAKERRLYQVELDFSNLKDKPPFTKDAVESYHSIQRDFPMTYGIGDYGFPYRTTQARQAQIKQLKAYLLFFEQILSNYLSQLGNFRHLFSLNSSLDKTYFSQLPKDIPGLDELYLATDNSSFEGRMQEVVKEFDPFVQRRNRFLDHLLARFGENFATDFLIKYNAYSDGNGLNGNDRELINAKIQFLRNYVAISRNRGLGYNYLEPSLNTENNPGLKERICLFLNIKNKQTSKLSDSLNESGISVFTRGKEHVKKKTLESKLTEQEKFAYEKLEDKVTATGKRPKGRFSFASSDKNIVRKLLIYGTQLHNYNVLPHSDKRKKSFIVTFRLPKSELPLKVYEGPSKEDCSKAIERLIKKLRNISAESEGFHIIEHILLRPIADEAYNFNLVDDDNQLLMTSYQSFTRNEQRYINDDLMLITAKAENYLIEKQGNIFIVVLKDEFDKLIGKFVGEFEFEGAAEEKIESHMAYFDRLRKSNISIYTRLQFYTREKEELTLDDAFFSHRISVILPSWPYRFQNHDFRQLLMSLITLNLPAHLSVRFHWLEWDSMKPFEELYFKWLQAKATIDTKQPDLDVLSYKLGTLIGTYEDED